MEKKLEFIKYMVCVLFCLIVCLNLAKAYWMDRIWEIIKEDHMMIKALYNQIEAPLKVLGG